MLRDFFHVVLEIIKIILKELVAASSLQTVVMTINTTCLDGPESHNITFTTVKTSNIILLIISLYCMW